MQREEIEKLGGEHENAKALKVREVVKKAAVSNLSRSIED